jgi:hypothetical protein
MSEANDPGYIGSAAYEYREGAKLGRQDAKRNFSKRFVENHSHFAAGYSEAYDQWKKDNPPQGEGEPARV